METTNMIEVGTTVPVPVAAAWKFWTEPQHITKWCQASDDWHAPHAENDVRTGGKFTTTMAAKDGSFSFDFGGEYTQVKENEFMESTLGDGRKMKVTFIAQGNETRIVEHFEPENQNPPEFQKAGWQAIIDNFKKYVVASK